MTVVRYFLTRPEEKPKSKRKQFQDMVEATFFIKTQQLYPMVNWMQPDDEFRDRVWPRGRLDRRLGIHFKGKDAAVLPLFLRFLEEQRYLFFIPPRKSQSADVYVPDEPQYLDRIVSEQKEVIRYPVWSTPSTGIHYIATQFQRAEAAAGRHWVLRLSYLLTHAERDLRVDLEEKKEGVSQDQCAIFQVGEMTQRQLFGHLKLALLHFYLAIYCNEKATTMTTSLQSLVRILEDYVRTEGVSSGPGIDNPSDDNNEDADDELW